MNTVDDTVVTRQCALFLEQPGNSSNIEHLNVFFDIVATELTKNASLTTNIDVVAKVVAVLNTLDKNQLCKQNQLIEHQLLIILRDCLIKALFDKEKYDLVSQLSIFFHNICHTGVLTNEMVKLFLFKPLTDEICLFFVAIEKYSNQTKLIDSINRLLQIFQRIQMVYFDLQQNPILERLFDTIAQCMESKFFINVLQNIPQKMSELDAIQTLLFDTCIEFMYWQSYEDNPMRKKRLHHICETLLHTTMHLLSSSSSSSLSEPITQLTGLLTLNVMVTDENIIDKDYHGLINHCVSILDCECSIMIKRSLLGNLCHLTYDMNLLVYMKNSVSLKPLLLKMSNADDFEISFNAYRILAVIMTEEDIKTLANSEKIVGVFYLYFISMIDDPIQKTAFHSLLHSLKSLVQHDLIKVELIRQGMVPLLIQCVIEPSFHTVKIRQYALDILLALSFNNEGSIAIKHDTNFMSHLKILKNSHEEGIQRAADHLIWQLEQKASTVSTTKVNSGSSSKFDVMLSYSHSDKTVCFQVYERLAKDGYHVWLDRDQMHGDTMSAMADAIENSEFILVCMSDAYKQSPYCQAEAHYAFERRRKLVPLVMKTKYKPDGWLGIIVSGKIYIDFSKFEFEVAYSMLKTEIEKKRNIATAISTPPTIAHERIAPQSPPSIIDQHKPMMDLPQCIDAWSNDHVRSFLIINNFTSLLPVFTDFNGYLLRQAYSMCQASRETMFQSMRSEVAASGNTSLLTLGTYLRFLEELKKYTPMISSDTSHEPTSVACNVM